MFSRLFGKKEGGSSPPPPSNQPRTGGGGRGGGGPRNGVAEGMEKLDTTIELLEKREAVLDKKIELELNKARDCQAKKNKNGAIACLKRKKMYEEQITKLQAQRNNMETMKFALQEQAMNHQVLEAQRRAGTELQSLNRGMNAENIEDDMELIRDAMDEAKEVSDALTQPIDGNYVDEDELLAELDDLTTEDAEAAAVTTTSTKATTLPDLGPAVPNREMPVRNDAVLEEDEEDALAQLEAELNS